MLIPSAENRTNEIFAQLSDEDRESLIALPYRVGMFISQSDLTGGEESDEAERQTLNRILIEISQDYCKSEFVQKVLLETTSREERWSGWADGVQDVSKDCAHFVDTLSFMLEPTDLLSFKETLMDIAQAVAMSYRENQRPAKKALPLPDWLTKLIGGGANVFDHPNISAAERKALHEIAQSLSWRGRQGA